MTAVYITIDTEYSFGLAQAQGIDSRAANFARSIACRTPSGEVGIFDQMDIMDAHGCKGVFFVDPLPALLWGVDAISDIVEPIVARDHEVQLHLHTEWLELAGDDNPLGGKTGRNMADFSEGEQAKLIALGKNLLVEAGAPEPVAFRAGNYGADDATLRALAQNDIRYDSSHVPGIEDSECEISLDSEVQHVIEHEGVLEVPVGTVPNFGGLRHAQITALSEWELAAAVEFATANSVPMLNVVSHSFELMSRDRTRANALVRRRFTKFCETIDDTAGARSATFTSRPPMLEDHTGCAAMPHNPLRSVARMAEQAISNALYGSN